MNHSVYLATDTTKAYVEIQKVLGGDCLSGSLLHLNETCDAYLSNKKISKFLKDHLPSDDTYRPQVGDFVSAKVGEKWYRGYVMVVRSQMTRVALIDYGRVITPDDIRPLVEESRNFAELGVRILLECPFSQPFSDLIGMKYKVKEISKSNGKLKCTLGALGAAEIIAWEPMIEEAGLRAVELKNQSKVYLSAFHSPNCVYLRSADLEEMEKMNQLLQDVAAYCLKAESLKRKPYGGELLCARFSEDMNFYRAQVFEKVGGKYKVNFVDYGNTDIVGVEDMVPLADELKKVSCCSVKVGLKDVAGPIFTSNAMVYLNSISDENTALDLQYDKDLREVVLMKNKTSLNDELNSIMKPSRDNPVGREFVFMNKDLKFQVWEECQVVNGVFVSSKSFREVLVVDRATQLLKYIESYLIPTMSEYCNAQPDGGYNPRKGEVCIAKFEEDGNWYRALCQSSDKSYSLVFFVDYGNIGEVHHRDIRKMIPDFMLAPAVLKNCTIYGLPQKEEITPEVQKKILDLCDTAETVEFKVMDDFPDGSAVIWVPSFLPKFEELGLNITIPPGF